MRVAARTPYDERNAARQALVVTKRGTGRPTIVHLVHERIGDVGGIQRFDLRVLHSLATIAVELDCNLEVIGFRGLEPGVELPALVHFHSAAGRRRRLLWLLARTFLRTNVEQVFIGHLRLAKMIWPISLLFRRSRYLLFVHGIEVWLPGRSFIHRLVSQTIVNRLIDDVVSVSRFTATRMRDALRLRLPRTHVLPNALEVTDALLDAPCGTSAGSKDGPVVLTVARMDRHDILKGIPQALHAILKLMKDFPRLKYRVVGDGELRKSHETLAQQLGISANVEFLGRVSDQLLNDIYARADVFLLPSAKEGFGIVFLEAWRAGLPIVCGNVDASAEVVENGVDGYTVDPDDPSAIAAAIRQLISDPQTASQFVAHGRRKLLLQYSDVCFADTLRAITKSVAIDPKANMKPASCQTL